MKWNNLNETQPIATERGNWDGLKSEPLKAFYGKTVKKKDVKLQGAS